MLKIEILSYRLESRGFIIDGIFEKAKIKNLIVHGISSLNYLFIKFFEA